MENRFSRYFFVTPGILVLVFVLIIPLMNVLYMSFNQDITAEINKFVGFSNYNEIIKDSTFWKSFINTVVFTVMSVLFHLIIGVGAALLLNEPVKMRTPFRIIMLVPYMFSSVVVAGTWKWMFNSQFGVINDLLTRIGLNGTFAWLGDVNLAMPSVILANVWRGFPFIMIMVLAGLQSISKEEYEASSIDGATGFKQFRYITLPHLKYIISIGLILDTIWTFKYFDLVQVMTNGGPANSTEVLVTLVFKHAFEYFQIGYASALAVIVFLILLVFTFLYLKLLKTE